MTDYIMEFLADADILGATAFQGGLGFGENQKIKRPGRLFSFDDPPMLVTFIDEEEKEGEADAVNKCPDILESS